MHRPQSSALRIQRLLFLISASLTALTVIVPDWIETAFGFDPDAGSGAQEWGITLAFAGATIALFALSARTRRRDHSSVKSRTAARKHFV